MIELALTFLKHYAQSQKPIFSLQKIAGVLLLIMSIATGAYFIFIKLAPVLGLFETGILMSGLLMFIGLILLFLSRRKKHSLVLGDTTESVKNALENFSLKEFCRDHKQSLVIGAFLGGVVWALMSATHKNSKI